MAEDPHNTSDISDYVEVEGAKEDAETTAARRELKQTSISEKGGGRSDDKAASDGEDGKESKPHARSKTPEAGSRAASADDRLKDQISSPKKKRAHDQLDEPQEAARGADAEDEASTGDASVTGSRTDRSEPEKKRPRDKNAAGSESGDVDSLSAPGSTRSSSEKPAAPPKDTPDHSAFAKSTFAKLASSTASPFGALGASGKPSVFAAGSAPPQSSFAPAGAAVPKLNFGGTTSSATPSPFANINGQTGGFGRGLGGGGAFGSLLSGPRLSSFAKPGETFKSEKPARPFGAPDSDADDKSDDNDEEGEEASGAEEGSDKEEEKDKDEAKASGEDKKKLKLQKVFVDDGEAGEVTLLQVRAKMFQMEKGVGWKERGGGMLKINVPQASVEYDKAEVPRPETFDASVLEADDDGEGDSKGRKGVRLIMRQDHTLRVILNTAILPMMDFHLTKKLKSALVLFTAFDGNEITQVQMKMSEANATAFTNLVESIKKELRDI